MYCVGSYEERKRIEMRKKENNFRQRRELEKKEDGDNVNVQTRQWVTVPNIGSISEATRKGEYCMSKTGACFRG